MSDNNLPRIFVIGNEKGGAGKTTFSMHIIIGLMDRGYKVASIDTDCRQKSLTSYIDNRHKYNKDNSSHLVDMPEHFHMQESRKSDLNEKEAEEAAEFEKVLEAARQNADIVVIDTPGSYTNLSRVAHSYADTVITPVNDSFIDLDVVAKIEGKASGDADNIDVNRPSIYSEMLWQQRMERASRDQGQIDWVLVRNRLSSIDARNKRKVHDAIADMQKRLSFRVAPGLSERVIFRELFPYGLTLLDLTKANFQKTFSISHVAARQEVRDFLDFLGMNNK